MRIETNGFRKTPHAMSVEVQTAVIPSDPHAKLCESIRTGDLAAVTAAGAEAAAVIDEAGRSGLHLALRAGHAEVVSALLQAGAKDIAIKGAGWTGTMITSFYGHASALEVLLKASGKAAAAATDGAGTTALMLAASRGHLACAKLLLDVDPESVHGTDIHGRSPLIFAVSCDNNEEMLRLLIKHGAKINEPSKDGKTPLIWAVLSHQPTSVETLALLGADPDIRDIDSMDRPLHAGRPKHLGQTALDYAANQNTRDPGLRRIAKYLIEWERAREERSDTPPGILGEAPWVIHARESARKAAEAEAEAARKASEAPTLKASCTGADDGDIFGNLDTIEDVTNEQQATPPAAVDMSLMADGDATFVPTVRFEGAKDGMVFKLGEQGLGYYPDNSTCIDKVAVDDSCNGDLDDLD